jgi:hypothetical protein
MPETPKPRIIGILQLWASKEEQLEYQRSVPIAHVTAEMFCFWDEVFWPDDAELRAEFSQSEWTALLRFDSVFERVFKLLPPGPSPTITEFIQWPHWLRISKAAARALESFDSPNDHAVNHALQRTAPHVTAPASTTALPPTVQVPRRGR